MIVNHCLLNRLYDTLTQTSGWKPLRILEMIDDLELLEAFPCDEFAADVIEALDFYRIW